MPRPPVEPSSFILYAAAGALNEEGLYDIFGKVFVHGPSVTTCEMHVKAVLVQYSQRLTWLQTGCDGYLKLGERLNRSTR